MLLRVRPTPTRPPINTLYTPVDSAALHSILIVWRPWGNGCCCLGIAPRAKMLKESAWQLRLNLVTRLHLPHAMAMKLHVRKSNVVILILETAVTVGV